ncbi:glycoside hydrolase family 9 protein [candidate division KSB1 bacterium]|nr:glycoside hydrolase family 9 protein [candidate division KSB1 bacterium]
MRPFTPYLIIWTILCGSISGFTAEDHLIINDQEYLEMPGLNVMVFHDYYPEGHQTGVTIIQNGTRVAANGDIRLEPTPGQWQPMSKSGKRKVDAENLTLSVPCVFPDPKRNRTGFNPIKYPDLELEYNVVVIAESESFRIRVDLSEPLPEDWVGKVGFNLELFPGELFGHTYNLDGEAGLFPRQFNGPMKKDQGVWEGEPLAEGNTLVIAPECDARRMTIKSEKVKLQLLDGRAHHNNGWYVVHSLIAGGKTKGAMEWLVTPHIIPDWTYDPVIQVSQVGYHPDQKKITVIECDKKHKVEAPVLLKQILPSGEKKVILEKKPENWGQFLRYQYLQFDFSEVKQSGMYVVCYGETQSAPFQIDGEIYDRHVWQPTLEIFLPVQMCHMRINDRYRVWHDFCHMDDALMAPLDTLHFDGYHQGSSTLTKYKPLEPVPGLNSGGWHDAGDFDLRVESQAGTVRMLALAYEEFGVDLDQTSVDQETRIVELHRPDGKPDALQQIEHGILTILGGYKNLGRLYRGIICPQLRQYVMLGDAASMTDNEVGGEEDRWVFTEENPRRELSAAAGLAAASRALKGYNDEMALDCINVAKALYQSASADTSPRMAGSKIDALSELILATEKASYKSDLKTLASNMGRGFNRFGWSIAHVLPKMDDAEFNEAMTEAAKVYAENLNETQQENPYGVPYHPNIWGAGWNIQRFGVQQYFMHKAWPELIPNTYMLNALNFVLGCHPGENTSSFVSGVGAKSVTVGYGLNRADWSYIPGGSVSGTAYIRPDFPELKIWPFFWQQTEYVIGGGATNFMFLALAAQHMFND